MYFSLKKHFKNNGVTYNEKQNKFVLKFTNLNLKDMIYTLTSNNRKMRVKSNDKSLTIIMQNEETANEFAEILKKLEILT